MKLQGAHALRSLISITLGGALATPTVGPSRITPRLPAVRALVLSDQAVRLLTLQYRSFQTEFLGCMIGEIRDGAVRVDRIAPADVRPLRSTATEVVPETTCEEAGWTGTVGMIHSHPTGARCWYYFPGTQVPTSDAQSFGRTPYAVDAIMCGAKVVWIGRDTVQREFGLVESVESDGGDRGLRP